MDQFLTLKDLTSREGTDDVVGLIENVINVAPELDRIMGRPIPGLSYSARIRTAIAANGAFRDVNGGVSLSASSYSQKRFRTFPFDTQMQVDEALIEEREAEGQSMASLLTEEAQGSLRAKALVLGRQFYQGTLNDAKGCPGLIDFLVTARTMVDSRTGAKIDQTIEANGTTAYCENVWFVKQGPQGIHWLFGRGRGIYMNPWRPLPMAAASGGWSTKWCANLFGYIGLSMANFHAVGAIMNVDVTNGTDYASQNGGWDDKAVAALWAKFPITEKPDIAFCSQNAAALLQKNRSVTNFVSGVDRNWTKGAAPVADFPTTLPTAGNIPLIVTDSIPVKQAKITLS